MSVFERFKEELSCKEKFYSSSTDRKISNKEYEHFLNIWNKFELKSMKDYQDSYVKCDLYFKKLWIISKLLFERTSFKLRCNA